MSTVSTSPEKASAGSAKKCGGCPHLASQHKAVMERLKVLVAYAHVCRHRQALLSGRRGGSSLAEAGDRSRKRLVDEMPGPSCAACGSCADRLHACLQCDSYACKRRGSSGSGSGGSSHLAQHQRSSGHVLALDFARMHVFCAACGDYVYDAHVTSTVLAARTRWHAALCDAAEPEAKRPRIVAAATGELSAAGARYAREHGVIGGGGCAAVRGVLNLGATCYLSAVVQALAHNPLVRGWMLSDTAHGGGGGGCARAQCMACEIDAAVQALHRSDQIRADQPFAPVRLLRTLWATAGNVAGAGQQDAHECLVAVLDALHASLAAEEDNAGAACACVVHTAFAGVLQSAVTCERCGNTTRSLDPMLDISLDIPTVPPVRAADAALNTALDAKQRRGVAQASMTRGYRPVLTLHDCLAHYTRAEALAPGAYRCARCPGGAGSAAAVKQLSVKELPPVLTFQLKRFAAAANAGGNGGGSAHAKVDSFVRLPLHVDMTPYTAAALSGSGAPVLPPSSSSSSLPPPSLGRRSDATHANPACQYSLFAVIDHTGLLDTGHYTAYARHRSRWFRFDDAAVTPVDVRDVLGFADDTAARLGRPAKGRAYMAFYIKTVLDYHDATAPAAAAGAAAAAAAPTSVPASADLAMPDDWIEESGVLSKPQLESQLPVEVKVERRGRKKGSTNAARKQKIKEEAVAVPPPPPPLPPIPIPIPSIPLVDIPQEGVHLSSSEGDSDSEALWARISKEKAADDLVPMADPFPTTTTMFINPAALIASNNNNHEEEGEEEEEEEVESESE
ncbi:hypothetical protein GGI21_003058 [Coemansia aciculifera]|nr:hypothetical protein GGI21_003058 [Coemansia aciculifera]